MQFQLGRSKYYLFYFVVFVDQNQILRETRDWSQNLNLNKGAKRFPTEKGFSPSSGYFKHLRNEKKRKGCSGELSPKMVRRAGAGGGGGVVDPGPTLWLVMEKGPLEGQELEFSPGTRIQIGRILRGNTLSIKEPGISTKHLAINFQVGSGRAGKSGWTISDIGSSNGTFLNSDSLEPFAPARLTDGDVIRIGECTLIRVRITVATQEEEEEQQQKPRTRKGGKLGMAMVDEDNELELGKIERSENVKAEAVVGKIVSEKRTTRNKKNEELLVVKNEAEEEEETTNLVDKLRPRRGRGVAKKEETGAASTQIGVVESSRRVTRSKRKEGTVVELIQDPEMGKKITRKGARRKKNVIQSVKDVEEEAPKEVEELRLGVKEDMIQSVEDDEEEARKEAEELGSGLMEKKMEREKDGLASKGDSGTKAATLASAACTQNGVAESLERVTMRTRNVANVEELVQDPEMGKKKITRKGARGKDNVIQSVKDDDEEEARKEAHKLGPGVKEDVMMEKNMEGEKDRLAGKGDSGIKDATLVSTLASGSGTEAANLKEMDLEKMTLGDFFDYLEVSLPQQIIDITEVMISEMRQKGKKFHDFMLEQKNANAKGKLSLSTIVEM